MRQYQVVVDNKDLVTFLNSVASMVSVLNMNRQIIFVNKLILQMVGVSDIHEVLGKRLGELFNCQHAFEVNGCGTSPHCSACGAVRTQLACVRSMESVDECSLTNDSEKITFDLRVHSTFTRVYGEDFIICSLFDISNEKRRGVMERIFFHDIMNTINGISGIAQVLSKVDASKQPIYLSHLTRLMNSLTEEIQSHRVLTLAEKNEYRVAQHQVSSLDFVRDETEKYQQMASLEAKEVRITDDSENHSFVTDKTLLSRVLGNMIKNAIEAEHAGALIEVCVRKVDDKYIQISVHNDGVIPHRDQLQVFNRSFSTKGENRGLGTYSMKLLTEKYLNGNISFVSQKDHGTTFTVKLPVS
ncbi:MAG: HAMP domain-containing histidine kinase [Bacteroidales bacterium]|nr:HAMP domain-containing histidine kinase [Bacteroidales bacterium]